MVNAPDAGTPSGQRSAGSVFQCSSMQLVEVPLRVINRPLPSELTEEKVLKFMDDIQAGDQLTPIEVLRCELPDGRQYYFSFGGCHRYEANKRLGRATIPSKIINVPPSVIRQHLGAGCPF